MSSPLFPLREKAVRDRFEKMDRETLTPWAFFHSGKAVQVTNSRGDKVSYNGGEFEGSPREVFWHRFFIPCLEDIVVEQMDAAVKQCRDTEWPNDEPLTETAELLGRHSRRFLDRMADIDRRLCGKGYPDKVPLRSTDDENKRIGAIIDSHLAAGVALLRHTRPPWLKRNGWWVGWIALLVSVATFVLTRLKL